MDREQRPIRFNRVEALGRIGRRVRATTGLEGVKPGTCGRVMEIDEIEPDGFELIIEWESRVEGKFQHDWFTKEQFELSLVDAEI